MTSRPGTPAPRRGSRLLAIASLVLFGAGALHVARWLRERRELAGTVGRSSRPDPAVEPQSAVGFDSRMADYFSSAVRYGPVREVLFGLDRALFTAGPSLTSPEQVFGEILRRFVPATDAASIRREFERGPSAIAALRTQATVGRFPGGVYLVRLAPETKGVPPSEVAPSSIMDIRSLRTEPGGIVLAFDYGGGRFEYALFYFPSGVDVEALSRAAVPRPEVLANLGPEAADCLSAQWSLGGDPRGGMTTTLCRANGLAGTAVDRVAAALTKRGFKDLSGSRSDGRGESADLVRVLESPRGTIWLTTSDRDVDGGLVTVTMTAL